MALDGKLLARAKARLDAQRNERDAIYAERERRVYEINPRVREIDEALRATMMDVIGQALQNGDDPTDAIMRIRDNNLRLQEERFAEISAAGFAPDYLENTPACRICGDSGYFQSRPCSCLMALYEAELTSSLSNLYKLGSENFDSFSLSWYDDTPDPATGISARTTMEMIYETCINYARTFSRHKNNLLLSGPPGLGKTFLSACIARVVSENGFSVVYDTANTIFSRFETEKFVSAGDNSDEVAAAKDETRRYYECDLLIIDDLGTELTNSFTVSTLYDLINTRILSGKRTVISTNLTAKDLMGRYSPALASRLLGEFQLLRFTGTDIRLLKKGINLSGLL